MNVRVYVTSVMSLELGALGQSLPISGPATILLKEDDGDRVLSIGTNSDRSSILAEALYLSEAKTPPPPGVVCPTIHNLLLDFMKEHKAVIEKITITELRDGVYHSLVHFKYEDGRSEEINSETTDAIILAIKAGCPIFVNEKLLKKPKERSADAAKEYLKRQAEAVFEDMKSNDTPKP